MRTVLPLMLWTVAGPWMVAGLAFGKLPDPSAAASAQTKEAAAKSVWSDKVDQYKLCLSGDRVADSYRRGLRAAGKTVPIPTATAGCVDPGPYSAQSPAVAKPLEASGAHSPPETAASPPSTNVPAAAIAPTQK